MLEQDIIWRLIVATLLGAVLGLERSLAGKHAGMRTYALVCLGSALFTATGIAASYEFAVFQSINPLQLAGYVAVGIGFIGSGLAVLRGEHPGELTTAAGVWVVASIGVATGLGYTSMAIAATVLGILVFSVLSRLEHRIRVRFGDAYTGKE